jgi:hypothetical protein
MFGGVVCAKAEETNAEPLSSKGRTKFLMKRSLDRQREIKVIALTNFLREGRSEVSQKFENLLSGTRPNPSGPRIFVDLQCAVVLPPEAQAERFFFSGEPALYAVATDDDKRSQSA